LLDFKEAFARTIAPYHTEVSTFFDKIASSFVYIVCFPAAYIGTMFTVVFSASLAAVAVSRIKHKGLIFLWLINTIVFFSLFTKKNVIYAELMLPAVAIIMALALMRLRNAYIRKALIVLILILSVVQYLLLSFYDGKYDVKKIIYYPSISRGITHGLKYLHDIELFTRVPSSDSRREIIMLANDIKKDLESSGLAEKLKRLNLFPVCHWRDITCKTAVMLYMMLEKEGVDAIVRERTLIYGSPGPTPDELMGQVLPNDIVLIGEEGNYYNYKRLTINEHYRNIFLDNFLIFKEYFVGEHKIRLAVKRSMLK
jgi:hypothetical protein